MINNSSLPNSSFYLRIGLCLITTATVLFELVLTRLFSATAGYHFAFMIVSIAMFGMTLGALATFIKAPPDRESIVGMLISNACLFTVSIVIAIHAYDLICDPLLKTNMLIWLSSMFVMFAIPFYFSGVCVSLCLSKFKDVGKLYSADLVGAALGCPLLVVGLLLTNAQNIFTSSSWLAAIASVFFVLHSRSRKFISLALLVAIFSLGAICLPFRGVNAGSDQPVEYVKWSPIGRVIVSKFVGSALSWAKVPIKNPPVVDQKALFIDFGALTVMTQGRASIAQLEPMRSDITAAGDYLRPNGNLFVIGVGGGRDILTGLLYGQKLIDGIEVNPAIVDMLTYKYANFTDHLTQKPGVQVINDEARNWLARSNKKYDLIQCSLVDTWAASSSGAYMLAENVLYTKEAFALYLAHLKPHGILSFSRWGSTQEPWQVLRMLNLAEYGLASVGIKNYGEHILLVGAPARIGHNISIGNMIVSINPFSHTDIENIIQFAKNNQYELLWVPAVAEKEPFASLIRNQNSINPGMPSDDCPFFFTPVIANAHTSSLAEPAQGKGLILLFSTFLLAVSLVILTIMVPAWTKLRPTVLTKKEILASTTFFGCLGLAFMQVEVGQIERLTVVLGNPTYSLSVVLFSLLLAAGIGSYVAELLVGRGIKPLKLAQLGLIACTIAVIVSAAFSLNLQEFLSTIQISMRILAAIGLVSIPAFFMGWGFPLGMLIFTSNHTDSGAWFWAVNGATSVLGSVLAAMLSVILGITATMIFGAVFYLIACLSLLLTSDLTPRITWAVRDSNS